MRNNLMEFLKEKDIETGINYVPNHLHLFYNSNCHKLPETESAFQEILSLPLHCSLRDEDVDYIINSVKEFFGNG